MSDTRRGQVLVVAAAAVLVLGVIAAFTIDVGNAYVARARLQNAADAAVLAAAQKMTEERNIAATEQTCRQLATTEAQKLVNANWDAARFEISFGRYDGGGVFVVQDTGTPAQAVSVVTVRDATAPGGPLGAFFAPLVGINSFNVSATTICRISSGIWKIRFGLLPFTVDNNNLVPPGQSMTIYPTDTIAPGNFGLLDFNGGSNPTPEAAQWIRYGYEGEITIDRDLGYVMIDGEPGLRASLEDDVESRIGDIVFICVYDQITGQGSNAHFRIIKFVAVTLLDVRLTGKNKYVTARVERIVYAPDGESGAPWSDNLAKISLTY